MEFLGICCLNNREQLTLVFNDLLNRLTNKLYVVITNFLVFYDIMIIINLLCDKLASIQINLSLHREIKFWNTCCKVFSAIIGFYVVFCTFKCFNDSYSGDHF